MTISKVSEATKLTKKAIRYYESVDLINSTVLGNGYRDYGEQALNKLIIIKTLRQLSFSIEEIKLCFSNEKAFYSSLTSKTEQLLEDKKQLSMTINFLNNFMSQDRQLNDLVDFQSDVSDIGESHPKLLRRHMLQVFPGDFGEILAAAYGKFLDEELLTPAQVEAWNSLIIELDEVDPFEIPQNLVVWAKNTNKNSEKLTNNYARLKKEYGQTYEKFSGDKKEALSEYFNSNNAELIKNQELVMFLSTDCREVVNILGRYLPLVSKSYEQFFLKQKRFLTENAELVKKLNKN